MNQEITKAIRNPGPYTSIPPSRMRALRSTPQEMAKCVTDEAAKSVKLVKQSGAQLD